MAFSELLADRVRQELSARNAGFEEKKMMGGLTFMVNDKMCVGVLKEVLMVRLDPDLYESCLAKKGARPMDFTGRPMKGFIFVEPDGTDLDDDLSDWISLALDYNPRAASSKKRKK